MGSEMCIRDRVCIGDETLFTVSCESIANTHPAIYRSALVGMGSGGKRIPAIAVEPWPEHWPATEERRQRLVAEVEGLLLKHETTQKITRIMLMKQLPVDIRHNSKIFREKVAVAAAEHFSIE